MPMPKKQSKGSGKRDVTIVAESCNLEGNIEVPGTLVIHGSVTGNIMCGSLELGKDSNVKASAEAESIIVGGFFEGEMICTKLVVTKTGSVKGNIVYDSLSLETGAVLEGSLSKLESKDIKLLPFQLEKERS